MRGWVISKERVTQHPIIDNFQQLRPTKTQVVNLTKVDQLTQRPLVSIIVPSFNQGRFIAETIDSILSQDYRPIEVLVMDGASTDETLDVLESYRVVPELKFLSE